MIGRVVSIKTDKTATVIVSRIAKHPLYKKTFIRTKKYLVDADTGVQEGDMVEMIKVRPISKNKHWKITKVVGKNLEEITKEKLKSEAEKIIAEVMPEEKKEVQTDEGKVISQKKEDSKEKKEKKGKE
ncbi:MAG: 30S ribosomal protein S17 [uncultured bacterium]|uniref:30S ribosomal protein S17 n=1 Tax=Candidatus Daviesbacteria bacterium GW2011_GWC2_40_12 TaxID=1618431 RepID=A0A0G0T4X1_9BACT|nr:MAG: 30S ribosomal protein S17 [uncultured bacterium]KKQ85393.1 MAG: 30S ribosomal protein S17 [Candidatus Daviesbacteria bacterium GW2011_GWF2_38_7]KKR17065.1 MAG: 30S ribosomal protein S17 [Candidatus Daviesbacteria bacterium GW2011_GWA2_39_33]KKR24271.1 MAG: 30S ribosomal protein S17 [Candidatus Daviesbacteria bacterium GW2011_GWB1_39_5]KKR42130.1 MAG: 30S ribosomal protein S17 [Candidatus Daviesbacteria bacterium GW2011_GWC2_40_12]OGE20894.1 MAG: 30S ribosomal protein S17 [Candidatus Da